MNETDGLTTNPIFVLLCWTPDMGGNMNGEIYRQGNEQDTARDEVSTIRTRVQPNLSGTNNQGEI